MMALTFVTATAIALVASTISLPASSADITLNLENSEFRIQSLYIGGESEVINNWGSNYRLVQNSVNTPKDRTLNEAEQLFQQSTQLFQQARFAEALPLVERLVQILKHRLGETHPAFATALHNLAILHKSLGNYTQAEPLHLRALHIRQQVLGEQHPDVAQSLNTLADLYESQGKYSQVEALYQRALKIREQVLGQNHPDLAITLNNLAGFYERQGNYTQAEALYQRSLQINHQAFGERHLSVADSVNNLAVLYSAQGKYSQAEPLYRKSLQLRETLLGDKHPDVADSLNNLAELYRLQGSYTQAEPLYGRSLRIYQQTFGENHLDVANSLNNLAILYYSQHNYAQAEPLYLRSLQIRERILGGNHPTVALSLNNLATLYQTQGNYAQAEPFYLRALRIQETAFGKNHLTVAVSLKNLATLYRRQDNYAQAESLYLRSLRIREQVLGEHHPDVADSLNSLAVLYSYQGNYAQAESLHQRSLRILENTWGTNHPDVAHGLSSLALLYWEQGKYAQAEPLYLRSLPIWAQAVGSNHPNIAIILNNLAWLYQNQGKYPQALSSLKQGLAISEINLEQTIRIGSETRKQAFMAMLQRTTDTTLSWHLQSIPAHPEAAALALTTLLRHKGRVLEVVTDTTQRLRQTLNPLDQVRLSDLQTKQSQLASLIYSGLGTRSPQDYRTQVTELRSQIETLENALAQRSTEFRIETQPVTLKSIAQQIPKDAVLIEWVQYRPFNAAPSVVHRWGKPRYAAYLLDAQSNVQSVDLGDAAAIDDLIQQTRIALQRRSFRFKDIARKLDAQVMQPVRSRIGSKRHLLLSPDSQLHLIPFAALVDERNQYLAETYTLTYLTSGRDLLRLFLKATPRQGAILIANPNYDDAGTPTSTAIANTPSALTNRRSTDLSTQRFAPLPGTEQEAQNLQPLLSDVTLLTGSKATENYLKQVKGPQILHIATHGFFFHDVTFVPPPLASNTTAVASPTAAIDTGRNPSRQDRLVTNENPLLRSGLALAGFNVRRSGTEDGVLTALEAAALDLRGTQLVVLSACDTGLGDVVNGEGVYGLRRALAIAGAQSQLISLWKVDDYATSELMTRYYRRLRQGYGRSAAFRQVQLELLQTPEYQHPYFWAAFIFSGNWDPLP